MRYVGPYRCQSCDFESPVSVSCVRCSGPLVDHEGRGPCRRRTPGEPYFFHGRGRAVSLVFATLWTFVAVPTLVELINRGGRAVGVIELTLVLPVLAGLAAAAVGAWLVGRRVHATQERRWLADERGRLNKIVRSAMEIERIEELQAGGQVRFRGRVRVLDDVGGYAAEQTRDDDRTGGRFIIEDESGAALFDDDCFELWTDGGRPAVHLLDGDEVEVVGQGVWAPSGGLTDARSYRGGGEVFVLDGSPTSALHVRRLPSSVG